MIIATTFRVMVMIAIKIIMMMTMITLSKLTIMMEIMMIDNDADDHSDNGNEDDQT